MSNSIQDLQYAIDNGIIDFVQVQEQIEMKKKQELLAMHTYKIWEGKDGNWYTYLPDEKRRKKIKKKSKDLIEKVVCDFYKAKLKHSDQMTLRELYMEWLEYKELHTRSSGTMKRLSADWEKFYAKDKIADKKINEITQMYLDEWVHSAIKEHLLNRKAYYRMSMPIRQMMVYAVKSGYLAKNPMEGLEISKKILQPDIKKKDRTQVFMVDEIPLVYEEMWNRYRRNPETTATLAVLLAFETGVRVGELAALKFEDICGNNIHIQRQETKTYQKNEDGTYRLSEFEVVPHTKSDAGDRLVYLTEEARKIIQEIKMRNEINQEQCEGYLFVKNGKRIKSRAIVYQLDKCLDTLSIEHRSIHKARKTYVSALVDAGVNINEIRRLVGHADVRTTYNCYCYNRYGEEETNEKIEAALHPEKKVKETEPEKKVLKGSQKVIDFSAFKKTGNTSRASASRK